MLQKVAIAMRREMHKTLSMPIYTFFTSTLLQKKYREIFLGIQQLMPAVFAKGFEDTFLYVYNRFISLNEVGSEPIQFGTSLTVFHRRIQKRAQTFPFSMNTTSTHDTKRSVDMRMRMHVISEMPDIWEKQVFLWKKYHAPFPDANFAYFFYQTLVGIWPDNPPKQAEKKALENRIVAYLIKAGREAKKHTDWIAPNEKYEKAWQKMVHKIIGEKEDSLFWQSFYTLQKKLTICGMYNSLSALLLKLTLPGVADFYQGEELWQYHMVDPDNRGEVDFAQYKKLLHNVHKQCAHSASLEKWIANPKTGHIKMYLTWKMLRFRQQHAQLFLYGKYIPVNHPSPNVIAFQRKTQKEGIFVYLRRFYYSHPAPVVWPRHSQYKDIFSPHDTTLLPFSIQYGPVKK